jgi:hypothetical protein
MPPDGNASESNRALKLGDPCPCGRQPSGRQNSQIIGSVTHTLKNAGQPERFACATCAEEAPFHTLVRRMVATGHEGKQRSLKMVNGGGRSWDS